MSIKLFRNDLFWGYAAQSLNIGFGLIMLPLIVRYMSKMEVGLWFVFISLASLAQLLELGFQPTLARNVAYIYAGAQKLSPVGLQENGHGPLNIVLLSGLVAASQWIYRRIAFIAAIVLLIGGTLYIASLIPKGISQNAIYAGWIAFVIGNVINFYYGYLNALLQGRGDFTEANKVVIASKSIQVLVGAVTVIAGWGLLGLGIASLFSTVISRILARRFVFANNHPEMNLLIYNKAEQERLVKILWHNSNRFGIVLVGAFLIWRANILIASSFLGLAEAASYGLAVQLLWLLNTLAMVPFNLSLPKLNALRSQGDHKQVYNVFSRLLVTSLLVYTAIGVGLLLCGNVMLNIFGSSTLLPSGLVLLAMVVVFLLETNHGICAMFITTGNHVPFVNAAVLSGVCVVAGSLVLSPMYGLAGLVISQGFSQLLYNNWKWPKEVGVFFSISYIKIIMDGFVLLRKRAFSSNNSEPALFL